MLFISIPVVTATDISSSEEHDDNGELSGNYTVKDGATWTVSGTYEVADETSIVVEEGSTMVISGSMNASSPPQLNLNTTSSVIVPVGYLGPSGTMRIVFAATVVYNIAIEIGGNSTADVTGDEFDWIGNMDVDNITINISSNPFQTIGISEIILSPEGATPEMRTPSELLGEGISISIPDRAKAWSLDVQGTLIITGSVFGAEISCSGTCTLDGAVMTSTSPIDVTGSISVTDSTFSHVQTDEDIIAWDNASVTWINSTGTGGETDNWVKVLTTRTIGVQNGYIGFYGYEMGYSSSNTSLLGDNNTFDPANAGDNIIEIGHSKRDRMVSWQDGDGVLHTESASGKIVLSTPWGIYEHVINDLPKVNHFDVELELPHLSFDSLIASDDEHDVNSRLGVMATITNSGNAAANILLDCTANGNDANVGTTVPYPIAAGETIEIPMNWDSAAEGDFALECSIFVPYQFYRYELVLDGQSYTSNATFIGSGSIVATWIDYDAPDCVYETLENVTSVIIPTWNETVENETITNTHIACLTDEADTYLFEGIVNANGRMTADGQDTIAKYLLVNANSGTATTESVSWSEAEDNSNNLFIPIAIGIVVAIIIYVMVARKKLNQEVLKEHLTEISEAEEDDDETGTIE
jgi:hypothetical protein